MINSTFAEYKEAIGILATTSQHIRLVSDVIKTQLLPKLKRHASLIDVGAGAGVLTKQLENIFSEITAVEINPELKQTLANQNYDVHICDFFEFKTEKKYDLVLCSHVMYHYNEEQMSAFIDKLLSLVSPGGYCFIVLMAPRGQNHRYHLEFNSNYVNSQQIINMLEKKKLKFDKIEASNRFTAFTQYQMYNLLKFFAIEDCLQCREELSTDEFHKIEKIVDRQTRECQQGDKFVLEQEEDYIMVPST